MVPTGKALLYSLSTGTSFCPNVPKATFCHVHPCSACPSYPVLSGPPCCPPAWLCLNTSPSAPPMAAPKPGAEAYSVLPSHARHPPSFLARAWDPSHTLEQTSSHSGSPGAC